MRKYYAYIIVIALITPIFIADTNANKVYCDEDSECMDEQMCHVKTCVCKPKYISNGIYCFPEAGYGERCFFDDQCFDHRQVCLQVAPKIEKCQCDRYYEYDLSLELCVPRRNLTDMLVERYNNEEMIERQAKSSYLIFSIVGISVGLIAVTGFISALLYCARIHQSDRKLELHVKKLEEKFGKKKPGSKSEEKETKIDEAAVVPIIQDNMILGDF